LYRDQGKKLKK